MSPPKIEGVFEGEIRVPELTDDDRDNIAACVYADAMVSLAREVKRASGLWVRHEKLLDGSHSLRIDLGPPELFYTARVAADSKRPRSALLSQIVAGLAHHVGGCDCVTGMVCPAATEVVDRCKRKIVDHEGAARFVAALNARPT